ncbi:MAG: EAL domain-containing protein [Ruminococcus sp.]|nr:EAL domain-containing protein [Ruminococcus sp.]
MDILQKQMLDDVFDAFTMLSNGAIVSLMHVQGNTTRWSPAAVELFGLSGEYIPNGSMDWGDFVHPEDRKRYMDVMTMLTNGERKNYDLTYRVRTKSGEYGNFRVIGSVLRNEDGAPSLIGGVMVNQGLMENTDPVTVLPNKNAYQENLMKLLNDGKNVISLQVGISRFAEINEVYGYTYGNRVLQEIAWQIQEITKDRGTVYRTSGATFIILSDTLVRDELAAIYDHIRYQLQRGIQVGGIKNILTANGGLISSQGTEVGIDSIYSCLHYAYEESKMRKHGDLVDFNGSINYEGSKSLELINTIRDCAAEGCRGFSLEYHPVIDAETKKINGAEATIFWEDEQYGRVEPEDFMPILERDFIFEEIGDFIFERGLSDGVKMLERDSAFLLCLNVYRIQLDSNYFIDNLMHYLSVTGFPTQLLSLKFNSDCRFIGMERLKSIITKLHEHRILAVIGDFGSGTDSIGFLKSEPIDAVSIDSTFIRDIEADEKARNMVDHLSQIAAGYVKHINVKGIDTPELCDIAEKFHITTMQGKYFTKPLSFEELAERYYSDKTVKR